MGPSPSAPIEPRLSVLVPTYDRPDRVAQLLGHLDAQTLEPERFEVILVDDGSPRPVAVDPAAHRFALRVLRQENAGPAAARNLGLAHCRAPLTLILNDDAVPAPELCERHLAAHAAAGPKVAVLGTFTFTRRALESPFTQLLAGSDLLFAFPRLVDGGLHDWTFFWTCNLSIPTRALLDAGGFDAGRFDRAIVEDVELGFRLQADGYRVLHRADARCEHDHALSAEGYFGRAVQLGVYLARMYAKHRDPSILWCAPGQDVDVEHLMSVQATCEAHHDTLEKLVLKLGSFEREYRGRTVPAEMVEQLGALVRRLTFAPFARGVLRELEGHDPEPVLAAGPSRGGLTSIVVVAHDALDQTRRCLEALRAAREPEHPAQLVFVDNGSRDGTAELLAEQGDVLLIPNEANLGAPRARNQGLARARGERVVFMDNDVMVTPGWLGRLLFHAEVDGRSGCVGCLSDRAGHGQQLELKGAGNPDALRTFAERRAAEHRRQFRYQGLLTSFLLLVNRAVIERIGGFDERFSPWGFEDDDFTLRAHLAGFRNRVALDVFVRHEPYAGAGKASAHSNLLQRNWARFAAKWGLPAGTDYGCYEGLDALAQGDWSPEDLRAPFEGQQRPFDNVLAWPDYEDAAAVRELIAAVAPELVDQGEKHLVLRVDPELDGAVEEVLERVESVYLDVLSPEQILNVGILDAADPARAAEQALQLCSHVSTRGSASGRIQWLNGTGLPPVPRS